MKMVKLNGTITEVSEHAPSNTYEVNGELVQAEPLDLQDYESLVLAWAEQKGLLTDGSTDAQALKIFEEVGEFSGEILKGNMQAALLEMGDIIISCTIFSKQLSLESFAECLQMSSIDGFVSTHMKTQILLGEITWLAETSNEDGSQWNASVAIQGLCNKYGFTALDCLAAAYAKIKDRTGKTVGGTFIKD